MVMTCVSIVLLFAAMLIPVSAIDGNGYSSSTVYHNGEPYTVTLTSHFDRTYGAYTICYCEAMISVRMSGVDATYRTNNYGVVDDHGRFRDSEFGPFNSFSVKSRFTPCRKGMQQVATWTYMRGSATLYGDDNILISVYESK